MMRLWRNKKMRTQSRGIHGAALWVLLSIAPAGLANVIFVDADAPGANDGSSWSDAYTYLQDALMMSSGGDEIRVAQGTYKPDQFVLSDRPNLGRSETFQLINGVAIKGGYAGLGEPDPDERDIALYETILSGDLKGDDVDVNDPCDLLGEPARAENSYHVVTGSETDAGAVLDGFTITGGNANHSSLPHYLGGGVLHPFGAVFTDCTFRGNSAGGDGGGMHNGGSPTLYNCLFIDNAAGDRGGGMLNWSSSPTLVGCTFINNVSLERAGGGMFCYSGSTPNMTDCVFVRNHSNAEGGGIYGGLGTDLLLTDCVFERNTARKGGGGIETCCSPILRNCTFRENDSGDRGGGMHYGGSGKPVLENCTFIRNAGSRGGGMYSSGGDLEVVGCTFTENRGNSYGGLYIGRCNATITNCVFSGNSTEANGGGMLNWDASTIVTNCIFSGNLAEYGSGIWTNGSMVLANCTFTGNRALRHGGGICNYRGSLLTATNCIFQGNIDSSGMGESAQIGDLEMTSVVNYCCIDGWTGSLGGSGNHGGDPLFCAPGYWDDAGTLGDVNDDVWVEGDYTLRPGSPCIDAGDNLAVPGSVVVDLEGSDRFADDPYTADTGNGAAPIVDMGAYEGAKSGPFFVLSTRLLRVPEGGTATFTVVLPVNPGGTVEATVAVESGDPDITVESGAALRFDSSDYSVPQTVRLRAAEDSDYTGSEAIVWISAAGFFTAVLTATEADSETVPTVLRVDADAPGANDGTSWTDAFTNLQDALSTARTYGQVEEVHVAAGVYRPDRGGGSRSGDREAAFRLIDGVAVRGGYAGFGKVDPDSRNVKYYKSILSGDLSGDDGPDFANYAENSYQVVVSRANLETAVLDGFTISGGNAKGSYDDQQDCGGGLYSFASNSTLLNCRFTRNLAQWGGGMYSRSGSNPTLSGCAFLGNSAYSGGAVWNSGSSNPILANCVFSGNKAEQRGGAIYNSDYSTVTLINCSLSNNTAGNYGAALGSQRASSTLVNCILWGNSARNSIGVEAQLYQQYEGWPVINYSCVQGWNGDMPGAGNHGENPFFTDANGTDTIAGTEDDDLRLRAYSPCLDVGDNSELGPLLTHDIDGNPRIIDGIVDMGAYEGPTQCLWPSAMRISVPAGGTAAFTVRLGTDPFGTVEVTVSTHSGDPDIAVESGGTLTFDSSNYSQQQIVTLTAAEDEDHINGTTLIWLSSPGFLTVEITAPEADKDNILFVDRRATGANDGTSWNDAFSDLQDALSFASGVHEVIEQIRVAQGLYRPTETGDRSACFVLVNTVALEGGYAGLAGSDPNARDIEKYKTILSGDLNGDDSYVTDPCDLMIEITRNENSYHVVTAVDCDKTAIIDGFTITGGNANGSTSETQAGGALYRGEPTIRRCTVIANSGSGCAIHFDDDYGGIVTDSTISGNSTGGIESPRKVINCVIDGNHGRGVKMVSGDWWGAEDIELTNCMISSNTGGGVSFYGSSPRFVRCSFIGNEADYGAGVDASGCESSGDCEPEFHQCLIVGNTARVWGGAVFADECLPTFINCTVSHNRAFDRGGGFYEMWGYASCVDCIIWENYAGDDTATSDDAYSPYSYESPELVLADNVYSTDGFGGACDSVHQDPCFAEPGCWASPEDYLVCGDPNDVDAIWVHGDYHLKSQGGRWDANEGRWAIDDVTSPCIDTGDPASLIGLEPFPNGGIVNMGAYGGTAEASKSYFGRPVCKKIAAGDINGDCKVNFGDFAIMALHWLATETE
jgi:predicted outer membrane repeat protein